jgi:hypothetical protein
VIGRSKRGKKGKKFHKTLKRFFRHGWKQQKEGKPLRSTENHE